MKKIINLVACFSIAVFAKNEQYQILIGTKLGINFPSMIYSNNELNEYSSLTYGNGAFGLFGEYKINSLFSVRPGLKLTTRGQHIYEYGIDYEFDARYIELTIPIIYEFQTIKNANLYPYVLGSPVLGFAYGGDIYYKQNNGMLYHSKVNDGNLRPYAFGLDIGAGLKYSFLIRKFAIISGLEAIYHYGLSNTYSDKELSGTSDVLNSSFYNISGDRKHRGFEFGIVVSVPLKNFKKTKNR